MIQLRYRVPHGFRLTLKVLRQVRDRWIEHGNRRGVFTVHAIDWKHGGTQAEIRKRLSGKYLHLGKAGIVERYASPRWALCDVDVCKVVIEARVWSLARMLGIKVCVIEFRRTRRGWHVAVQWSRAFRPIETIAIQAILGSDPFRESFNLARVLGGRATKSNRWNLLFKEKLK